MVKEPLTQCHAVLEVLISCNEVTPVVLELKIPALLLLTRLLLMQLLALLVVTIDIVLELVEPLLAIGVVIVEVVVLVLVLIHPPLLIMCIVNIALRV